MLRWISNQFWNSFYLRRIIGNVLYAVRFVAPKYAGDHNSDGTIKLESFGFLRCDSRSLLGEYAFTVSRETMLRHLSVRDPQVRYV